MRTLLSLTLAATITIIGPAEVMPGDWFTPNQPQSQSQSVDNNKLRIQTEPAQQEAFRQYVCAVRTNRVWTTEQGAC